MPQYQPGSLVRVRNREWIVLPSPDSDVVMLKPLGGSEAEVTGVYLPLKSEYDKIEGASFSCPSTNDLGDISSARLLFDATRLAFRNGAGPFRSLAKLSFRPRSYQMVPLIMALRQNDPVRLLIADDVGVGKTVEALLILKELLERREIKRFAIIVLPHLCEQWQEELRDKFGIEAVIIRSSTQAKLDRDIQGDTSVFHYYPYQIISIDFIKSEHRKPVFVEECPELIIVDEAHTCTQAAGSTVSQQQRYSLIRDIAKKDPQHLILLTATPHSGKSQQFQSLLGLLKNEYADINLVSSSQDERRKLARHYVQRRRADVEKWLGEDTPFPEREAGEFKYELSGPYTEFYNELLEFTLGITKKDESIEARQKMRYWSALALLRGAMSSPAAGEQMLANRIGSSVDENDELASNPLAEDEYAKAQDYLLTSVLEKTDWTRTETQKLTELSEKLKELSGIEKDFKVKELSKIIQAWIKEGYKPVVFCRFIATANYIGDILKQELPKSVNVQVVTSEDPDEVRKQRVEDMIGSEKKVLIATDCLSEGINLQDQFTAVLHYDLPWNPNRLEQREGRIDRFGQKAEKVKAYLLYGNNNPIDGVVLKVLLRKVREIRKSIGITIPFPEESQSLLDAVMQAVFLQADKSKKRIEDQLTFEFEGVDAVRDSALKASNAIEEAAQREKESRSIFAQNAIKANEIEEDLQQADDAIGNPAVVESFVVNTLKKLLGVQIDRDTAGKGYSLYTQNIPPAIKTTLPEEAILKVSFYSPVPDGYKYIGRNHEFVEQLCQYLMAHALKSDTRYGPARASVVKCREVDRKITIVFFRVRNVIEEKQKANQVVAEEMLMWGYEGAPEDNCLLSKERINELLATVVPSANVTKEAQGAFLSHEIEVIKNIRSTLDTIAEDRAQVLIEAHERFRQVLGGKRYKAVKPVLPMDLMGVYVLLPDK